MAKKHVIVTANLSDNRRSLLDMAQGGDGVVIPTKRHFDPPKVVGNLAYPWAVVYPPEGGEQKIAYVDTEEQADKLIHIGDLGI